VQLYLFYFDVLRTNIKLKRSILEYFAFRSTRTSNAKIFLKARQCHIIRIRQAIINEQHRSLSPNRNISAFLYVNVLESKQSHNG